MSITGECFCGSVKYRVDGKLRDATSCHCSRCRKAFNAQASAAAFVESKGFKWLSGEELTSSYSSKAHAPHTGIRRFKRIAGINYEHSNSYLRRV